MTVIMDEIANGNIPSVEETDEEKAFLVFNDFKHNTEILNLIDQIPPLVDDFRGSEIILTQAKKIADFYQEQPHLIDPFLSKIINKCLTLIMSINESYNENQAKKIRNHIFAVLYFLCKTRGYKIFVKKLPHEVKDVIPVLNLLELQMTCDSETWETKYMLLLWLSILVRVPFDLVLIGSDLMSRLLEVGTFYLRDTNSSLNVISAFFMSHLLCRPDALKSGKLENFITNCILKLKDNKDVIGHLYTLATILKTGGRNSLINSQNLWLDALNISLNINSANNIIMRKMCCKLSTRIALLLLDPRPLAEWRYQRGHRSLSDNLKNSSLNSKNLVKGDEKCKTIDFEEGEDSIEYLSEEGDEDSVGDINEVIEVIDSLLKFLKDRDTIVRWSAAKGIGRICSRLSRKEVAQVESAIGSLFSRLEGSAAWHGGCLALAELARRGLLLPSRLKCILEFVCSALHFDDKTSGCAGSIDPGLSAAVRDAACYVCWAFARAYAPETLVKLIRQLAHHLILVTLFDREIRVRRAAAAAFQEHVGRQGGFPHGIELAGNIDYYAVGNRFSSYTELSVFVSQFDDYKGTILNHLVTKKIKHWDPAIRLLSSQALHLLVPLSEEFVINDVLPQMLNFVFDGDVFYRHGSLLASAEILSALFLKRELKDPNFISTIKSIFPNLSSRKQFQGVTGDLMRQAMCLFIEKCSIILLDLHDDEELIVEWYEFLIECVFHTNIKVQDYAVNAIKEFLRKYIYFYDNLRTDFCETVVQKFVKSIRTAQQECVLSGVLRSMSFCPPDLWKCSSIPLRDILDIIHNECSHSNPDQRTLRWGNARSTALTTIYQIVEANNDISTDYISHLIKVYIFAFQDYTITNMGDIGSKIRESSMINLVKLLFLLSDRNLLAETTNYDIMHEIVGRFLQQAVEKIDRIRKVAAYGFCQIIYHDPPLLNIPRHSELKNHFNEDFLSNESTFTSAEYFRLFCQAIVYDEYRLFLVRGLAVSIGGLTETTALYSGESLSAVFQENACNPKLFLEFVKNVLTVFEQNIKIDRVSLPMLVFLDFLLNESTICDALTSNRDQLIRLLTVTRSEISKSREIPKLKAATDVFAATLQFGGVEAKESFNSLMLLLGHKFPIIRRTTAAKLYEASLLCSDFIPSESHDELIHLLTETVWENDLAEIRKVRDHIKSLINH